MQFSGLSMRKIRDIDFLVKHFVDWFVCVTFVERYCQNDGTCKFGSRQRYENRAWRADSWKAYSKPKAFNYAAVL